MPVIPANREAEAGEALEPRRRRWRHFRRLGPDDHLSLEVQDQPGQHIPATPEAEAGGSLEEERSKLQYSVIMLLQGLSHRPPPARSGHRCVADNTNLYVFGGYNPDYDESGGPDNEDYPLFRELWRYHFATGVWHQMGTDGYMPRELASMSLVLHGNNLLVFGGTGIPFGESNGNDVHAMAIINGSLYVFGGTTGYIYSTDLHKLDLNTREWTQLKPNNLSCDLPEE
ncbi:Kelch domain-containing protein 10, partial [Plecturocebus cupreus]